MPVTDSQRRLRTYRSIYTMGLLKVAPLRWMILRSTFAEYFFETHCTGQLLAIAPTPPRLNKQFTLSLLALTIFIVVFGASRIERS